MTPNGPSPRFSRRSSSRTIKLIAAIIVCLLVAIVLERRRSAGPDQPDIDSIVLLGDSITAQGEWETLLPGFPIVNEGHSGFTTAQLAQIAPRIAERTPAIVVVLTGTNDIRDDHPPTWTAEHLGRLLDTFSSRSPGTTVLVQTILPRGDRPAEARAVADSIREVAASRGLPVLDLYPHFDDGSGSLRDGDTTDGVHLSGDGYRRWAALLEKELDAIRTRPG